MERKENIYFKLVLLVSLSTWSISSSFGQVGCVSTEDQTEVGIGGWIGHVYKYPTAATPNRNDLAAGGEYKGKLAIDGDWTGSVNFDYDFGDPAGNDTITITTTFPCTMPLIEFGVLFRGSYEIPNTGEYVITINHDDGARLRINGSTVHDRWNTYKHTPENERRYYFTYTASTILNMEIAFFERNSTNRLSFSIERYYGPGIISQQQSSLCSVAPDPLPFLSVSAAAFENDAVPVYQWQYTDTPTDPLSWQDISGANGLTYKIPRYDALDPLSFVGTRHFRRMAYPTGNPGAPEYTNIVSFTLSLAAQGIPDLDSYLETYGDKRWYGYVYDKVRNFESEDYIGRLTYPEDNINFTAEFRENFGGPFGVFNGASTPTSSSVPGATFDGCNFQRDRFSVRYMMKMPVTPGTYFYVVRGDDGFRMSIRDDSFNYYGTSGNPGDTLAVNRWNNGSEIALGISDTVKIETATTLYFILEYYENINNNVVEFESTQDIFQILPVEWGQVSGNPCGDRNCLAWETLQEKNTSHFTVERSYDGSEWTPVGEQVTAQGFSTQATKYQFSDASFMRERSFYRVKQVDLDGSMDYSETIRIDNHSFKNKMLPYPNPTVDRVRFFSPEEVLMIQVTSHDARVNMRADFEQIDQNIYELDFSQMQSSQYVITVVTKDSRKSHKIIKK